VPAPRHRTAAARADRRRTIVAAGLLAERTGKPTLAMPVGTDDDQILMSIDPVTGDEFLEQRFVEPAWRLHVNILDTICSRCFPGAIEV